MFGNNFTQDKSKIIINNEQPKNVHIKSDINKMLSAISNIYNKYPSFKFGYKSLKNFLIGIEDKVIVSYKLQKEVGYGIYKDKKKSLINKIMNVLYDLNIIKKVKNQKGFENIDFLQNQLTDDQLFVLDDLFLD